jgi:HSP20 family protein
MTAELEKREKQEVGSSAAEQMNQSGLAYSPDVDIHLSDDEVVFTVDLPGVGKGDVTINVDETDTLVITGKNSHKEPENALLRQYEVGDFYRAFQLSEDYNKEKITARLENGVLVVTIPKKEEAKPKKIEIKA